ncbi:hypothetical protein D9V32_07335 [Mycetocola tolaasinivorans]|uniref:ABC transporter permease n=2 Tax=Mycetocola tolaasinivorans TaxID=76635 RepID=A0A3L7A7B9_9MICO|nr:hypothetical protein D9V32_07335 [Mycetocola tolaasinivorans]
MGLLLAYAVLAGVFVSSFSSYRDQSFTQEMLRQNQLGRNVVTFLSSSPDAAAKIDRTSCEALSVRPDVQRSGLLQPDRIENVSGIDPRVHIYRASVTLFPGLERYDALIGSVLGADNRPALIGIAGGARSAAVLPKQPRGLDVNTGIVLPLSPNVREGEACIVQFSENADITGQTKDAALSLSVSESSLGANTSLEAVTNPVMDYLTRTERFLPVALGTIGALLSGVVLRARTSEFSTYRLSGTSRAVLFSIISCEQLIVSGIFFMSTALSLSVLYSTFVSPVAMLLTAVAASAAWCVAGAPFALGQIARDPITQAKER